jgi:hypothetical protein
LLTFIGPSDFAGRILWIIHVNAIHSPILVGARAENHQEIAQREKLWGYQCAMRLPPGKDGAMAPGFAGVIPSELLDRFAPYASFEVGIHVRHETQSPDRVIMK